MFKKSLFVFVILCFLPRNFFSFSFIYKLYKLFWHTIIRAGHARLLSGQIFACRITAKYDVETPFCLRGANTFLYFSHRSFNALSRCRLSQWWKLVACPAVMIIVWIPVQGLLPVGWLIDRKVWAGRNLTPRIKHIYTIPSQTDSNRIAFGLCFCVYVLPHPIEIRINTEPRLNFVVND